MNDTTQTCPSIYSPSISNPRDALSQDEVLMKWQKAKENLDLAKESEMDWRKYVVQRAFPDATEGTNKVDLGNGYSLKAVVKYNYNLLDNKIVEKCLDEIAAISDEGKFIADRLVSWTPNFLLTEYRELERLAKEGSNTAQAILAKCGEMLVVNDAAPTLTIAAPKAKK